MKNLKKFKTFNINENVKYLKVGDYYSLLKPKGYWSGDWEYLGYDKKTKNHIFRSDDVDNEPDDTFIFKMVSKNELENIIRDNQ